MGKRAVATRRQFDGLRLVRRLASNCGGRPRFLFRNQAPILAKDPIRAVELAFWRLFGSISVRQVPAFSRLGNLVPLRVAPPGESADGADAFNPSVYRGFSPIGIFFPALVRGLHMGMVSLTDSRRMHPGKS